MVGSFCIHHSFGAGAASLAIIGAKFSFFSLSLPSRVRPLFSLAIVVSRRPVGWLLSSRATATQTKVKFLLEFHRRQRASQPPTSR